MESKELIGVIKDVGVPIAMLLWFALRVEKKLEAIAGQLVELVKTVLTMVKELSEARADVREVTGKHIVPAELRRKKE